MLVVLFECSTEKEPVCQWSFLSVLQRRNQYVSASLRVFYREGTSMLVVLFECSTEKEPVC